MSRVRSALGARLVVGTALIVALAAVAWLDLRVWPGGVVTLLLGAFAVLGALEYAALLGRAGLPLWSPALLVATVLLFAGPLLSGPLALHLLCHPLTLVFGLAAATIVRAQVQGDLEHGFDRVCWTLTGFVYIPLALFSLVALRTWGGADASGLERLAWLASVAKSGDIAAYFVGRTWGRRKAFPRLSPGKTVEGCCASLAASAVVGVLLGKGLGWLPALGLPALLGAGIITNLFAQSGDLSESLLKRRVGAKDSATVIPGFGGVLDLVDSLLLAGPAFLAYWVLAP